MKPVVGKRSLVIAAIFGLLYAYLVWQALGNMIGLPGIYDKFGFGQENIPWGLLTIGLLLPIAIYALAFAAGLRHSLLAKSVLFFVGLATSAALGYGVIALHAYLFARLTIAA